MSTKSVRMFTAVMLTAGVAMLAGCNDNKSSKATTTTAQAAPSVINSKCPVSGEPVDKDVSLSYKGQGVGFCCKACIGKWSEMPEADRDAKMAQVAAHWAK